jgi:hypothetical protein
VYNKLFGIIKRKKCVVTRKVFMALVGFYDIAVDHERKADE